MRYLIFGDVHGNLPALEQLFKIEKGNYDLLICHGDVVGYGPWADECVSLLNQDKSNILLRGNHEDAFINKNYSGTNSTAKSFFEFCLPRFSSFKSLLNYQEEINLGTFLVRHTIMDMYIYMDTELPSILIDKNFIIGHSHHQFSRYINQYNIINTGSLGQNRKSINLAEYVVFDQEVNRVDLKSFVFDIDVVINEMIVKGYPEICINYYQSKNRV
jgi:predicted phosphodiesterase